MPRGQNFDSILVGYFDGSYFKYAASIRAGFTPASRQALFKGFSKLEAAECPFSNLPDKSKGRWGAGITAQKMAQCRWLKPRVVVTIDFLEWTLDDRLRHASFVAVSADKRASEVGREAPSFDVELDRAFTFKSACRRPVHFRAQLARAWRSCLGDSSRQRTSRLRPPTVAADFVRTSSGTARFFWSGMKFR